MLSTAFRLNLAVPVAEAEQSRRAVADLGSRLLAERELNRKNADEISALRAQLELAQQELERCRGEKDLLADDLSARDAEISKLKDDGARLNEELSQLHLQLEGQSTKFQKDLSERDLKIADLQKNLLDKNEALMRERNDVTLIRRHLERMTSTVSRQKQELKQAVDDLETVKKTYWEDCAHDIRVAAFHAFPNFEWDPVVALLGKHDTHPKEDQIILERIRLEDQQQQADAEAGLPEA